MFNFARFCHLLCAISLSLAFTLGVSAQSSDLDYLPSNQNYNPDIPLPADILGYPVGTWHARHDQIVNYMNVLSEKSDRVKVEVIGYSHEQRPLLLLTITGADNHKKIDTLRTAHIDRINSGEAAKQSDPLIIHMGYGVHGNEPSTSNAAILIAYHLAASNSPEVLKLLNENIVLLDPALNPDGLARFAQWANMHKGKNLVADPSHREHTEAWPSGRTNHYWFDLNRDWLLLTHPESKARVAKFQQWRPHILTDFHEMGTNSTYFFQPGVPSRKNPWTPDQNVTLTNALGEFHARALDADKQLYFTQESFDDFYFGKGSTYPDAHGSIGILFEQASSRGHAQESINGVVTFPRTIQNQVTTSLSTFAGALANKSPILSYQQDFYKDTQKLIDNDDMAGFLVSQGKDPSRFMRMLNILKAHKIEFSELTKDVEVQDYTYKAGAAVYIPLNQIQYRLIRSLFSERQRFVDNTFYDVSNWNIGLAFNLQYDAVKSSVTRRLSLTDWAELTPAVTTLPSDAYAYAFEWFDHEAPSLLQALLENNVQVRIAGDSFTAITDNGNHAFAKGTVVIPMGLEQPEDLAELLTNEAAYLNIKVHVVKSGLTPTGIDLGSRQLAKVEKPQVLIIGGAGTSSYEVGEIWHYLDTRLGVAATLWDAQNINSRDLDRYTHIFFASGRYSMITEQGINKIEQWVKDGGVLIGQKTALRWFADNAWIENEPLSAAALETAFPTKGLAFGDQSALVAKKLVAGAAYQVKIDLTHPLFFGFERPLLPMFKTNNMVLKNTDRAFQEIAKYTEKPLLAGYSADEMQELIKGTTAIVAERLQGGHVIGFVDNVHFRGYWDGTNKLTANVLYMSPLF